MTMRRFIQSVLVITASTMIYVPAALGSTSSNALTYQGRIVKSDGKALEYEAVSFIFQILDPSGQCVIYQERISGINMVNSGGVFDVPIGTGTVSWPSSGSFTVLETFNNSSSFTCGSCSGYTCTAGSSTYSAAAEDGRKLRVQFFDGTGWKVVSPDTVIRSVPYAGYSLSAQKLGPYAATDFILKNSVNNNTSCDAGDFLTWNAANKTFGCATPSGGSGGGSSLAGDVTGAVSATSVERLKGTALSVSALNSGQVLKYDGASWVNSTLSSADLSDGASLIKASQMPANCGAGQTLTFASPTNSWSCSDLLVTTTNLPTSITNALWTESSGNIYRASGNVGIGTASPSGFFDVDGGTASGAGGGILLRAQHGGANGAGGVVSITGGNGAGSGGGGNVMIASGNAGSNAAAGSVVIAAGSATGTGNGGHISLSAGSGTGGGANHGGSVTLTAGNSVSSGSGAPGSVNILGGNASPFGSTVKNGGAVHITGGTGATGGVGGDIVLSPGAGASGYGSIQLLNGNVGIGTLTPTAKLEVVGTMKATGFEGPFNVTYANNIPATFTNTSAQGVTGGGLIRSQHDDGTPIAAGHRLGGIIMGGAYDNAHSISSSAGIVGYAAENFTSGARGAHLAFETNPLGSTTRNEKMRITSEGRVGIGTETPGYKLDVQGGGVNASGGFTQTSDIRLKKNIEFLNSEKALEQVVSLHGIYYHWKESEKYDADRQMGLIAQEVQSLFPEAVKQNSEGFLSVSYATLVAPVIEAVKALWKTSAQHSAELASMKAEYQQLKLNDQIKAHKIQDLEESNALMKKWICTQDPTAAMCR